METIERLRNTLPVRNMSSLNSLTSDASSPDIGGTPGESTYTSTINTDMRSTLHSDTTSVINEPWKHVMASPFALQSSVYVTNPLSVDGPSPREFLNTLPPPRQAIPTDRLLPSLNQPNSISSELKMMIPPTPLSLNIDNINRHDPYLVLNSSKQMHKKNDTTSTQTSPQIRKPAQRSAYDINVSSNKKSKNIGPNPDPSTSKVSIRMMSTQPSTDNINPQIRNRRCDINKCIIGACPISEISHSMPLPAGIGTSCQELPPLYQPSNDIRPLVRIRCSICDKAAVYVCLSCQRVTYCSLMCQVSLIW